MEIFCDLDGVLANLQESLEQNNLINSTGRIDWNNPHINTEFWTNINPYQSSYDFYKKLKMFGSTFFLTGTTVNFGCHAGKVIWIQEVFGPKNIWRARKLILCDSDNKYLLAKPDRVLIDDKKENLVAWEKAGGIVIECDASQGIEEYDRVLQTLEQLKSKPQTKSPPGFTRIKLIKLDLRGDLEAVVDKSDIEQVRQLRAGKDVTLENIKICNLTAIFPVSAVSDVEYLVTFKFNSIKPLDGKDTEIKLGNDYMLKIL